MQKDCHFAKNRFIKNSDSRKRFKQIKNLSKIEYLF